jgi:hypothetical protein
MKKRGFDWFRLGLARDELEKEGQAVPAFALYGLGDSETFPSQGCVMV